MWVECERCKAPLNVPNKQQIRLLKEMGVNKKWVYDTDKYIAVSHCPFCSTPQEKERAADVRVVQVKGE